jgi:hypothetical protein
MFYSSVIGNFLGSRQIELLFKFLSALHGSRFAIGIANSLAIESNPIGHNMAMLVVSVVMLDDNILMVLLAKTSLFH